MEKNNFKPDELVYGIMMNDNHEMIESFGFVKDLEDRFFLFRTEEEVNRKRAAIIRLQKRKFFRDLPDHHTPLALALEKELWSDLKYPGEIGDKYNVLKNEPNK